MHRSFSRTGFIALAACALLAACSGGSSSWLAPGQQFAASTAFKGGAAKLVVSPSHLSMVAGDSASVTAMEKGYTLKLTSSSKGSRSCTRIAAWAPKSGKGPKFHVKVKATAAGSCAITFADLDKHTASVTIAVKPAPTATVFAYSGGAQSFTVPSGITRVTITAAGAQGGYSDGGGGLGGGLGGSVTATIPVTPGQVLTVFVGGIGNNPYDGYGNGGGFNGGGSGGCGCGAYGFGGSGGGASDVRQGGSALSNRVVVAGGGGGGAFEDTPGGAGGGVAGGAGSGTPGYGGGGGTATAGGAAGAAGSYPTCIVGGAGSAGLGGGGGGSSQTENCSDYGGGGGGGGYYGGGGGGAGGGDQGGYLGGGGGGSGFVEARAIGVTFGTGTQTGNGQVSMSW